MCIYISIATCIDTYMYTYILNTEVHIVVSKMFAGISGTKREGEKKRDRERERERGREKKRERERERERTTVCLCVSE